MDNNFLYIIERFAIFLPAIAALFCIYSLQNKGRKLFFAQIMAWTLLRISALLMTETPAIINHLCYLTEAILSGLALLYWCKPGKSIIYYGKYLIGICVAAWLFFCVAGNMSQACQQLVFYEHVLLCILSAYVLLQIVNHTETSLASQFEFWAAAGLTLFYLSTVEINALLKFFGTEETGIFNAIHYSIKLACNVLFFCAFIAGRNRSRIQRTW